MYMREMGTVELLTREGEIEIAKRIEGGLMDMMAAISGSPATIAAVLAMAEEIRENKVVISTIVDGFNNLNEADDYVAEEDFDEFDESDDDDGKGGSKALTKKLEELKNQALERFDRITELFETPWQSTLRPFLGCRAPFAGACFRAAAGPILHALPGSEPREVPLRLQSQPVEPTPGGLSPSDPSLWLSGRCSDHRSEPA